jgi:Na+/proline symporter
MDLERKAPTERSTVLRRLRALWPLVCLAFAAVVTLGWIVVIGWAAFVIIRYING